MKKHPLPKDSLKRIVKIMEHVEVHDEQLDEKDLSAKFGENSFYSFSRYCSPDYAQALQNKYKLTNKGLRKLYELRGVLAEESRTQWIKWATIVMALMSIFQFIKLMNWI